MSLLKSAPVTMLEKFRGPAFKPLYSTTVTVSGGEAADGRASGIARSDDGQLEIRFRLPAELGGPGGGANPEQLLAAAYGACFHGALSLLATRFRIVIEGARVVVSVAFGRDPVDGLFTLTADVKIHLPGVEKTLAQHLIRQTERLCPYAKMAKGGIESVVVLVEVSSGA